VIVCVLLPRADPELSRRLLAVSPLLERDGALVFLDDRGLARLHGGPAGLFAAVRRALLPDRARGMARAGNRFTAEVAARCLSRPVTVPEGDEALFLSRLPLGTLPLPPGLAQRIAPLGLESLGDFAALPAEGVRTRYGEPGLALHRLARGLDARGLRPERQARVLEIERVLDAPADRLALLQPVLAECVERLCAWLEEERLGAAALVLELRLDAACEEAAPCADAGVRATRCTHELLPPEPEDRAPLLTDLLARRLEAQPPGAAVGALRLSVPRTAPMVVHQNALFGEAARDAARRAEALARLAALFGPQSVSPAQLRRAHRTEERWAVPPPELPTPVQAPVQAPARASARAQAQADAAPSRTADGVALRWLPEPEALVPVLTGGRLSGFRRGREELRIARAHGPRRLAGGWWRAPWARDEYELLTTDGALYRVGRDLHARRWVLLAEAD
jgi:protein ImuB